MELKKKIKQYGIISSIKTYAKSGILIYAIFVFLFIKKNKTGLEQFRDIMNNKLFYRLYKKNRKIIYNAQSQTLDNNTTIPKIIWFCWMQGMDNAPELVKACFNRLKKVHNDYEINIITKENYKDFTSLPDYIVQKWEKNIITTTHFSDILRNNLLLNNGGFWIDSTVFLSAPIPQIIQKSHFFLFQSYKPGSNGKEVNLSSWFIGSVKNNPVLKLTEKLLFNYWKKKNYLIDYFLYHNYLQMSLNHYEEIKKQIPKYTNETAHYLLFELKNNYDEIKYKNICYQTFAHKLTYKFTDSFDKEKNDTYYRYIVEDNKK